jgi:hypothetical protein
MNQNQASPSNNGQPEPEVSKLAVCSFLVAIIAFIHPFVQLFGLEKALLALILGLVALREISRSKNKIGRGYAFFGIVLSLIFMVILGGFLYFTPQTLAP